MAFFRSLESSHLSISGCLSSETYLWSILRDLCCRRDDEVFFHGGLTGNPVPPFTCEFAPETTHCNILAVADEEGSLRLLNVTKSATDSLVKELATHSNAVFDISWKPGGKHISVQTGKQPPLQLEALHSGAKCCKIISKSMLKPFFKLGLPQSYVTASGDTTIAEWDVVRGESVASYRSHSGSVKTVDTKKDEPSMIVSGGRDGSVLVWDTRCSSRGSRHRPVNQIRMAHKLLRSSPPAKKRKRHTNSSSHSNDFQYGVTSVIFHGLNKVASCGAADGVVKLWDLRRTYTICRNEPPTSWHSFSSTGEPGRPFGFTSLVSDPWQSCLFASCTNDIIYQYSTSLLHRDPVNAFGGHKNSTFYVKSAISPGGRYLLSGSSCGRAFIWHVDYPDQPPIVLNGHSKEVTAVCWGHSLTEVVTCSDNNDLRIWRIKRNKKSSIQDVVGNAECYGGEGHTIARGAVKKISGRNAAITFRKKRVSSAIENRISLSQYSQQQSETDGSIKRKTVTGSVPVISNNATGGNSKALKRRSTGSTVVPSLRVLQLQNYFSRP